MKRILFIDTSDNKVVKVGLEIDRKKFLKEQPLDTRKAQAVLPLTEVLLAEHNLKLNDLTGIHVNTGPGSFTGLRVGITIANTLGSLLKIPINDEEVGILAEATYTLP
jgi:tRNA threonylcarbamoyladenosine biosynthesis protein TsaB